ncbi:hypothetical protein RRV45_13205 [Bacillus sp. DTU_2020_1000418_1_SI_GHA_SEK_038]|uniref:hypothetical protein n=1 Tax=Bacillus sp. DTU_2020_1000418_1_SI_GHA_SEK_038 TaxID=3077585 RepID=UPI0028E7F55E|nr:hypothetical protein [Bacillus sp. DTU_2020_1000418_1_SI_GHA_SEK_038]WNS73876.1 hypothetical protein RRV45_13205 [Bacillus sp. DTU_2020_1000418_1_SI_GHA_SEK_038]
MKQIVHLNEQIRQEVATVENECEELGKILQGKYENNFSMLTEKLIIELLREKKGKSATQEDLFSDSYKSYLEIGVEINGIYYPNGYIPIWKCKMEMFHTVGYLINLNLNSLEKKLQKMIEEIYEDHRREREVT